MLRQAGRPKLCALCAGMVAMVLLGRFWASSSPALYTPILVLEHRGRYTHAASYLVPTNCHNAYLLSYL